MTPEQEEKFKQRASQDLQILAAEYRNNWAAFSLYLDSENARGITEFRLVVNDSGKCYIHPLGKDGKTYDFEI